jgi:hypothetical protein
MRARFNFFVHAVIAVVLAVSCAATLDAVQVGQSKEDVIKELGAPAGKMEAGGTLILRYPDLTIKLKDGRVVAVDPYVPAPPRAPVSEPVSSPPPTIPPASQPSFPPRELPQFTPQNVQLHFSRHFVGVPSFETSKGWMTAGTAFLARRRNDSQAYILTAHHLFSPIGGMTDRITHAELPTIVRAFTLLEFFGDPKSRPVEGCLVPEGDDPKGPLTELALFKTPGVADDEAPLLAETTPSPGEIVWLLAKVEGGVPAGTILHKARVVLHPSKWLVCMFENPQINLNGTNGAPVLNADSKIVGVMAGVAESDGRKFAFVIPSPLILKTIREL